MSVRRIRPLLVLLVLLAGVRHADADIHWYKDLKEASAVAQKNNLPMFIDFWADWCGVCKIMDAEVYTDPKVIKAFEANVVGVRLHFDLQPDMARKYNVPALPFLVWTNSYGTPLAYHRGLLEAEDLGRVLEAMPDLAEINRLDRNLQKDKNNLADLLNLGHSLRESGFYETSSTYFERALKQKAAKGDAAMRESVLFDMGQNALQIEDGKSAAATFEQSVKEFPKSSRMPDVLLGLGKAYALDDKADKARKSLNAVIADYPDSAAAAEARSLLKTL